MVTGGLGFIGSNLARHLVELGADVLLVDSLIADYGGNLFNIDGIADRVHVNVADIRQQSTMNYLVRDRAVIFNLAGQVSHIDSMRDPYTDLEINCRSQLTVLEACRNHNPSVKVVFAGTRQVYGRPDSLPVSEAHLVRPTDVNGINKAAGEYYHLVYNNVFGVRACSLRLTNVYGPRQLIKHNRQGFIGWFIRLAIEGQPIQIYGDGSQLRDFVYVDDAADAFLRAGANDACNGEVFNVGGDAPSATAISRPSWCGFPARAASSTSSWPPDKKAIDIGSFYADSTRFMKATGWKPAVPLAEGLRRTIEFYRRALFAVRGRRDAAGDAVTRPRIPFLSLAPGHGRRRDGARRARGHRSRHLERAGSCSVPRSTPSNRNSPRRWARRTPSASAPAPTRSRSFCARSASGRATKSSRRRCRRPTRRSP